MFISFGVVAVLVSLLVPMLAHARDASRRAVCQSNLRQIGIAYVAYLEAHDVHPTSASMLPEWTYAGVEDSPLGGLVLSARRPVNPFFLSNDESAEPVATRAEGEVEEGASGGVGASLDFFRCPSDVLPPELIARPGITGVAMTDTNAASSFFGLHGISYRGNHELLGRDSGADSTRVSRVTVSESRLLLAGDPIWYLATLGDQIDDETVRLLSWHGVVGAGNAVCADGSVRFMRFDGPSTSRYTIHPDSPAGDITD